MDFDAIAKAVVTIGTPLAALIGFGSRRKRLRAEVRDNIALLEELRKDAVLSQHTPTIGWLAGKVIVDVARLSGEPLGPKKKPIPKGSVFVAFLFAAGAAWWTYTINRDGFVWYSVFPGTFAAAMLISILGMTTNRNLPADPELPPGATAIRSDTAEEQVASALQLAESGTDPAMFADDGQIGVAFRFIALMREAKYEDALSLADAKWSLCRIQSRLWNMHAEGTFERHELQSLAASLHEKREPSDLWEGFVQAEGEQFAEAWHELDPSNLGAASRRRRVARDYDLVVLAPLGAATSGYYVQAATMLPNAVVFLMHRVNGRWLVANHVGWSPPTPGWPPTYWTTLDKTFDDLPETDGSNAGGPA